MILNNINNSQLQKLPSLVKEQVINKIMLYEKKVEDLGLKIPQNEDFFNSLPKVWCCSIFVADNCIRTPDLLHDLVLSGDLFSRHRRQYYSEHLKPIALDSEKKLMRTLRQFRCREMIRIAWRDLANFS